MLQLLRNHHLFHICANIVGKAARNGLRRLPDGTIDRKALGAIVFSRPEELSRLVGITFPLILAECEARMDAAEAAGCRACVLDAPTLFESSGDKLCDVIVSVVTPREERLRRVLELSKGIQ